MKICKLLFCSLLIVTLTACHVKRADVFVVSDEVMTTELPAGTLRTDLPQTLRITATAQDGRIALFECADYEVMEEIFPAKTLDEALVHLTGSDSAALEPVCVGGFPHSGYRFRWNAAGEEGVLACNGLLLSDGTYYYALTISCNADKERTYRDEFSRILSGTELSFE